MGKDSDVLLGKKTFCKFCTPEIATSDLFCTISTPEITASDPALRIGIPGVAASDPAPGIGIPGVTASDPVYRIGRRDYICTLISDDSRAGDSLCTHTPCT